MLDKPTDDQLCYPDSNVSCVRAPFSVGAQVGLYVVFGLNILINVVGNSMVIISISYFKQLHSPTNLLVLSLAVADLLVGVTVIPFSMTRSIEGCWLYGDSFCQLHSNFDIFLCSVSILHIVSIAVDRYEAVCNPLRYTNNITMSVGWFMVLTCWLVPTFNFGLLYSKVNVKGVEQFLESIYCLGSCNLILNSLFMAINSLLLFFLPCSLIVILYTKIFLVAKEQLKKTENIIQRENVKEGLSKRSEHKAAKTLGIVVGVYIICWMPSFLLSLIGSFTDHTSAVPIEIFYWLSYFNSSMNPIIYALFYPWFRKCLKLIVNFKIFDRNCSLV